MQIDLYLVPGPVAEDQHAGKSFVMIDVLRASSTICQSLNVGARAVIPVEQPGEATEMKAKLEDKEVLLCGERKGLKIDNFDLGNSPFEYTEENIKGKTLILTTSNGTKGYARAGKASLGLTAGIVNVSKVAERLSKVERDTVILCAGNDGDFSIEDTLCGGMIIYNLMYVQKKSVELNDAASLALLLYRSNMENLADAIANGKHGRYLRKIGFAQDVTLASTPDAIPVLPMLSEKRIILETNEIEPENAEE